MRNGLFFVLSALLASGLIIGGLWAWQNADDIVLDWEVSRPQLILWSIRAASVAAVASAQVIVLVFACRRALGHSREGV